MCESDLMKNNRMLAQLLKIVEDKQRIQLSECAANTILNIIKFLVYIIKFIVWVFKQKIKLQSFQNNWNVYKQCARIVNCEFYQHYDET